MQALHMALLGSSIHLKDLFKQLAVFSNMKDNSETLNHPTAEWILHTGFSHITMTVNFLM